MHLFGESPITSSVFSKLFVFAQLTSERQRTASHCWSQRVQEKSSSKMIYQTLPPPKQNIYFQVYIVWVRVVSNIFSYVFISKFRVSWSKLTSIVFKWVVQPPTEQRRKALMYWVVRTLMSVGSAKAKMLAAKDSQHSSTSCVFSCWFLAMTRQLDPPGQMCWLNSELMTYPWCLGQRGHGLDLRMQSSPPDPYKPGCCLGSASLTCHKRDA